jgi:hypothetical protein
MSDKSLCLFDDISIENADGSESINNTNNEEPETADVDKIDQVASDAVLAEELAQAFAKLDMLDATDTLNTLNTFNTFNTLNMFNILNMHRPAHGYGAYSGKRSHFDTITYCDCCRKPSSRVGRTYPLQSADGIQQYCMSCHPNPPTLP